MTAIGLRSAGGVGCGVCFGAVMKVHTDPFRGFSQATHPWTGAFTRHLHKLLPLRYNATT